MHYAIPIDTSGTSARFLDGIGLDTIRDILTACYHQDQDGTWPDLAAWVTHAIRQTLDNARRGTRPVDSMPSIYSHTTAGARVTWIRPDNFRRNDWRDIIHINFPDAIQRAEACS